MAMTLVKGGFASAVLPSSIPPATRSNVPRRWLVRPFEPADTNRVCEWVPNRQSLQLVSGDDGECLTPAILAQWLDHSTATIVLLSEDSNEAAGFCTLASSEIAEPPPLYLELCHLVVDPRYRYLFVGPRICKAAKSIARDRGVPYLFGRVVPHHRYGVALARYERFEELVAVPPYLPGPCRWFRYPLLPTRTF